MFGSDINELPFDWVDSVIKETAVVINCCLEQVALKFLAERGVVDVCESAIKLCKWSDPTHKSLLSRIMNIVAKVAKVESACIEIMNSKTLVVTCLMYYANQEHEDLAKQCLLTFHQLCRREKEFRDICMETHKYPAVTFDPFVKRSITLYESIVSQELWDQYVNVCASITAFVTAFPERLPEYRSLIVPLIKIISSKTEMVRKNAAVLLAKLANDEENGKIMRANHGTEVLISLRA
jgi:hypothetical protein